MNSLFTLIKADLVNSYKLNGLKDPKNRTKAIGMAAIAFLVVAVCFLYIGGASLIISDVLLQMQLLEVLLVFTFALPLFMLFFMDVYKMPSVLFSFSDYDMLMSLPIKDTTVLAAKIIKLMLNGYLWQFLMGFPIFLVYCIKTPQLNVLTIVLYVLLFLVIPFLPMSIGSFVGLIVARISAKMRSKNVVIIIGSFVLLVLIMGISFSVQNLADKEALVDAVSKISGIESSFFLFKMYVDSVARFNIVSLLLFLAIFVLPFILFIYLFGKSFKKINSSMMETKAKHNIKNIKYNMDSPVIAIFKKELRAYTHCTIYIVNTFFGMVMLFVASIALLVSDFDFNSVFSEFSELGFNPADFKMVAIALFFGFCIMMSSTTASSISLEGKNLWIIKSLPVKPETIFMGKMMLGLAVTLPIGIISSFLVYIGIGLNFFEWFVIFILVIAYGFLSSVLGLFMNLLFPKIEFKSPTEVVKQSASVGLTILAGMLLAVLPMIISPIVNVNVNLFILLVSGVYALLTYMIWFFVKTKGVKKFQKL